MSAAPIAGATPFAWAQLGLGLLGAGRGTPAGPSSADALFGPSLLNYDASGWLVNMGDGATSVLDNGNRGGPNQTPVQVQAPNGYAAPVNAPNNPAAALGGMVANLPWLYIIGGGLLAVLIWKKA